MAENDAVTFPPGTTYEVVLSDDASLDNDSDEREGLTEVALRGWSAMLQYLRMPDVRFTVRATTYTPQPDGRLGKPTQTASWDVTIPSATLRRMLREEFQEVPLVAEKEVPVLAAACDVLAARGIEASYEYPGFMSMPIDAGREMNVGDNGAAGEPLGAQLDHIENGVSQGDAYEAFELTVTIKNTAVEIADAVQAALERVRDGSPGEG